MSFFTIIQMRYSCYRLYHHLTRFVHLLLSVHPFTPLFPLCYPCPLLFILHTKKPSINTLVESDLCWIFQYGSAYQPAPMTCLDEQVRSRDSHDELWNGYYTQSYISEELASRCTSSWISDPLPLSLMWTDKNSWSDKFQIPFMILSSE